jgi:hypothetical protein
LIVTIALAPFCAVSKHNIASLLCRKLFLKFVAGMKLSNVSQEFAEDIRFMRTQGHKTGELILLPVQRTLMILEGRKSEVLAKSELLRIVTEKRNFDRMKLM